MVDARSQLGHGASAAAFVACVRDADGNPLPDEEIDVDTGDGPRWNAAPGVTLTSELRAALDELAEEWHAVSGRRLHVTSGTRTSAEQAPAMLRRLRAGGRRELRTYRNRAAADEVGDAGENGGAEAELAAVIQRQVDRKVYLSAHLVGRAIHLRARDLDEADRDQLVALAGGHGRALYEGVPPHLQLELSPAGSSP